MPRTARGRAQSESCRSRSPTLGRSAIRRSSSVRAIARHRTSVCARTRAVRSPSSPTSARSPKTSPGPSSRVPSGASTTACPCSSTNRPEPARPRSISACPAGASNSLVQVARRSSWSSSRSAKSGSARSRSRKLLTETGQAEAAERPAGEAAELALLQAPGGPDRLVHGGEHHVGEQLRVVAVDRLGIDLDLLDLARAVCGDGDHAAAGARLDGLVLELALRLLHLLLHLSDLLHQLVHVHAHFVSPLVRARPVSP